MGLQGRYNVETDIYDDLKDRFGGEATDELLHQESAIKEICDYIDSEVTAEIKRDTQKQVGIAISTMKHWELINIGSRPNCRVYFTVGYLW